MQRCAEASFRNEFQEQNGVSNWSPAGCETDETANVWVPPLVVGLAAVFLGLTTKQGEHGYRKASSARV
jgi:hypothetical protein